MEGVLGVVTCFAADFAPKGWAYCAGQLLPIAQNQALFSLLGTTYGGNGINTFALPDLQGRTPVGTGQGTNLSNITLGEVTGTETVILTPANLPPHVHNGNISLSLRASSNAGDESVPDDFYPAAANENAYANTPTAGTYFGPPTIISTTIGPSGGSQPFEVLQPYLAINYIICLQGLFPSRN